MVNKVLQRRLSAVLASTFFSFSATMSSAMASLTPDQANLKGLKVMSVYVEEIKSNSCDVTESQVKTSVLYTLSQSKIVISSNLGVSTNLYVNVNIFPDCSVVHIDLQLNTIAKITQTNHIACLAVIWDQGFLLANGDMESRVNSKVDELTKKFVVDWNTANP
jgi:hypothetical protein